MTPTGVQAIRVPTCCSVPSDPSSPTQNPIWEGLFGAQVPSGWTHVACTLLTVTALGAYAAYAPKLLDTNVKIDGPEGGCVGGGGYVATDGGTGVGIGVGSGGPVILRTQPSSSAGVLFSVGYLATFQ